jgi:hypothetical protein
LLLIAKVGHYHTLECTTPSEGSFGENNAFPCRPSELDEKSANDLDKIFFSEENWIYLY